MKGKSSIRADELLRRRAREDLVRKFMRARSAAATPVQAIPRAGRRRTTAAAQ
jgi:hypothetical protein